MDLTTALPVHFHLDLPAWASAELQRLPEHLPDVEARMAAVLRFARLNWERETGGPFAAGVCERDSGSAEGCRRQPGGAARLFLGPCRDRQPYRSPSGAWVYDPGRAGMPAQVVMF